MSGIYIPGVSMPKDGCKSCAFDILGICLIKANMDKPYEVTHSCPLIELPPHGRLGDLDALAEKDNADYEDAMASIADVSTRSIVCKIHDGAQKMIAEAPTIIPADPDGGADR